jgi:two-component system, NarL family, response regulator NreC
MSPASANHPRTRVLVVAGHFAVCRGLVHLLGACPDLHLAGEARDVPSALSQAAGQAPDVIVLDWPFVDQCDGEFVSRLRQCAPSAHIVFLVAFGVGTWWNLADAVLPKSYADEYLLDAVRALRRPALR